MLTSVPEIPSIKTKGIATNPLFHKNIRKKLTTYEKEIIESLEPSCKSFQENEVGQCSIPYGLGKSSRINFCIMNQQIRILGIEGGVSIKSPLPSELLLFQKVHLKVLLKNLESIEKS